MGGPQSYLSWQVNEKRDTSKHVVKHHEAGGWGLADTEGATQPEATEGRFLQLWPHATTPWTPRLLEPSRVQASTRPQAASRHIPPAQPACRCAGQRAAGPAPATPAVTALGMVATTDVWPHGEHLAFPDREDGKGESGPKGLVSPTVAVRCSREARRAAALAHAHCTHTPCSHAHTCRVCTCTHMHTHTHLTHRLVCVHIAHTPTQAHSVMCMLTCCSHTPSHVCTSVHTQCVSHTHTGLLSTLCFPHGHSGTHTCSQAQHRLMLCGALSPGTGRAQPQPSPNRDSIRPRETPPLHPGARWGAAQHGIAPQDSSLMVQTQGPGLPGDGRVGGAADGGL